jgi:hypothetical protein
MLTAQSPLFRDTSRGRLSAAQTALVAGALTANAPPPQGRTRPDALITFAGYARRRREIWRNPSGFGEGVALQNGAQGSAAEMRMLCPTGSEHIQRRYIVSAMICPILVVGSTWIAEE